MFVGQRREGFVINLGEMFDLINTNPLGSDNAETNDLAGKKSPRWRWKCRSRASSRAASRSSVPGRRQALASASTPAARLQAARRSHRP